MSSGDKHNLRPDSFTPWESSNDAMPTITIQLTEDPSAMIYVESVMVQLRNADRLEILLAESANGNYRYFSTNTVSRSIKITVFRHL